MGTRNRILSNLIADNLFFVGHLLRSDLVRLRQDIQLGTDLRFVIQCDGNLVKSRFRVYWVVTQLEEARFAKIEQIVAGRNRIELETAAFVGDAM